MNFELSSDQNLFLEAVRRFLDAESSPAHLRALHENELGFDSAVWRQAAELGFTAMLVPERLGGGSVSEHGLLDLVLVAEEMGRSMAPEPLLPVNLVLDTLGRVGSPEQKEKIIPALLTGDSIATWAFDEGSGAWNEAGIALEARREGDGWILNGSKAFVQEAAAADWFLVTARASGKLTQFIVSATEAGVSRTPRVSIDLARKFGDVRFTNVRLPASAVVGEAGDAGPDVERQIQIALVLQNAEMVGALDHVFAFTLEYANDRITFGRPISSYQVLKHRFADMKMWLEACHGTATASAEAVASGGAEAAELVSVAKSYIADRAPFMIQDCVQIHGGIGVTWEHDLHLYLRRATQYATFYGGVRHHRERLAAILGMGAD
jgi:alkylation response protein AidB-like acyl-CoA dehydrogenase